MMDEVLHLWVGVGAAGGCLDGPWLGWGEHSPALGFWRLLFPEISILG